MIGMILLIVPLLEDVEIHDCMLAFGSMVPHMFCVTAETRGEMIGSVSAGSSMGTQKGNRHGRWLSAQQLLQLKETTPMGNVPTGGSQTKAIVTIVEPIVEPSRSWSSTILFLFRNFKHFRSLRFTLQN